MEETTTKSWWSRNWKWVVPVGCVSPLLIGTCCCGGFLFGIMGLLKSSDAYRLAVDKAKADPAVIEALGEPITPGWYATGSTHLSVNYVEGARRPVAPGHGFGKVQMLLRTFPNSCFQEHWHASAYHGGLRLAR